LNLIGGYWYLCPACGIRGCPRHECHDWLQCGRANP
jgi:hypothetical protein